MVGCVCVECVCVRLHVYVWVCLCGFLSLSLCVCVYARACWRMHDHAIIPCAAILYEGTAEVALEKLTDAGQYMEKKQQFEAGVQFSVEQVCQDVAVW